MTKTIIDRDLFNRFVLKIKTTDDYWVENGKAVRLKCNFIRVQGWLLEIIIWRMAIWFGMSTSRSGLLP